MSSAPYPRYSIVCQLSDKQLNWPSHHVNRCSTCRRLRTITFERSHAQETIFIEFSSSSQAIGYGLVAVTFSMQSLMKWACDRLNGWRRIVVADLFLAFSFVGTVNVWRGIWQLLDIYFLPGKFAHLIRHSLRKVYISYNHSTLSDDRMLGDFISHTGSFVLLALLNCSNSVLVRGVYIDAEEPNGQCVVFPIYYIRLFFEKERTKKQQKHLESTLEKGEHSVFLLEKSTNNMTTIVKSSSKSIEMTAMLNSKNTNVGNNKDNYIRNKDHIITD